MKEQTRWPCSRELVLWKADPALSPKGEQEEIMTLRFGGVWGCAQGASQWKLWLRTNVQSASTNRGPKQGVCMEGALAVSPCQPCLPLTKPIQQPDVSKPGIGRPQGPTSCANITGQIRAGGGSLAEGGHKRVFSIYVMGEKASPLGMEILLQERGV